MLGTREQSTRAFFQHEIFVIQALNANPRDDFYAPKLIEGDANADIVWMATEWIDPAQLMLREDTFRPLVSAIRAIRDLPVHVVVGHACWKDHTSWGFARYVENIDDQTGRLVRVGLLSPANRNAIMRFAQRYAPYLEDYERAYPGHGDFAPCNLAMRDGQVVVLDWESSHLDRGPIDVAHYVSTFALWRSDLASRLEAELWKEDREVLTLAKIERLAGRANDTYRRRRETDHHALWMLEDLVRVNLPQ